MQPDMSLVTSENDPPQDVTYEPQRPLHSLIQT